MPASEMELSTVNCWEQTAVMQIWPTTIRIFIRFIRKIPSDFLDRHFKKSSMKPSFVCYCLLNHSSSNKAWCCLFVLLYLWLRQTMRLPG